jgi:DNA primase
MPTGQHLAGIDYRLLRAQVTITEVLALIGYQPSIKSKDQWRGPCPLHHSTSTTSRTFSVNTARNLYQCFKCGSAGNQLDLWAALTKQGLYQAGLDLCNRLQLEIPRKGADACNKEQK